MYKKNKNNKTTIPWQFLLSKEHSDWANIKYLSHKICQITPVTENNRWGK